MKAAFLVITFGVVSACRPVADLDLPADIAHIAVVVIDADGDVVEPAQVGPISDLLDRDTPFRVGVVADYVVLGWPAEAIDAEMVDGPLRVSESCDGFPTPAFARRLGEPPSDALAAGFPVLTADGAPTRCGEGEGCIEGVCVVVAQVATARQHTCARLASGKVACTGRNSAGQAGVGTEDLEIATPTYVVGIEDAVDIDLGHEHSCAVHADGRVSCWGLGTEGRLGDGAERSSSVPVVVNGIDDAREVALGALSSCVRRASGDVSCFGDNFSEQLGDGSNFDRNLPVPTLGIGDAAGIVSGWNHVCAVRTNGTIRCWGENGAGQLGSPYVMRTSNEVAAPVDAVELAAGDGHTCARTRAGEVYCWGINGDGQVGDGTTEHVRVPTKVELAWPASGIVAGGRNTCAFASDGRMSCWGQVAGGLFETELAYAPQRTPYAQTFGPGRGLDFDIDVACRIVDDDGAECWGANALGATGTAQTLEVGRPRAVAPILAFAGIGPGNLHACGFDRTGAIACWGRGIFGETTRIDDVVAGAPRLAAQIAPVRDVRSSQSYSCARHDDRVSCWGSGHLGAGEVRTSSTPRETPGLRNPIDLDVSDSHACAVIDDGRLMCWGASGRAVGVEETGYAFFPIFVPGVAQARRVAVGRAFTCFLRDDETVQCLGANLFGQLGRSGDPSSVPERVEGLPPIVAIEAGIDTACAVSGIGDVWCWGAATQGVRALDATQTPPVAPNRIDLGEPATAVTIGSAHACALGASGQLWCWGFNHRGQAGGAGPRRAYRIESPKRLDSPRALVGVAAGSETTCAWNEAGDAWCFGENTFDQLGAPSRVRARTAVDFLP